MTTTLFEEIHHQAAELYQKGKGRTHVILISVEDYKGLVPAPKSKVPFDIDRAHPSHLDLPSLTIRDVPVLWDEDLEPGDVRVKCTSEDAKENDRVVAVCGGGDWVDASVDHVALPPDADLDALYKAYREWLKATKRHLRFPDWLVEHGGAEEAQVETYYEL